MSITRKIQLGMLAFGLLMGAVFPFYARFFTTYNEGMQWYFDIGCLGAGAMIGVISFQLVKKFVLSEIRKVADALELVNQGDLSIEIQLKSDDSLGELADSFNHLTEHFRVILSEIKNLTQSTSDFSNIIVENTTTMGQTLNHVQNESQTVSHHTQNCSNQINQTSQSSREISSQLKQATSSMSLVAEGIRDVCAKSTSEAQVTELASEEMHHSMEEIQQLSESIHQIYEVVTLIQKISDKTNLLALNATIEAASAGDAGKGFGVVANEVKELANQTKQAVGHIYEKIQSIESEVDQSVNRISKVSKMNHQLKDESMGILKLLEQQYESVDHVLKDLQTSHHNSDLITESSQSVNLEMSEVGSKMQGLSSQITEANSGVNKMQLEMESLKVQINSLNSKTSFFKF